MDRHSVTSSSGSTERTEHNHRSAAYPTTLVEKTNQTRMRRQEALLLQIMFVLLSVSARVRTAAAFCAPALRTYGATTATGRRHLLSAPLSATPPRPVRPTARKPPPQQQAVTQILYSSLTVPELRGLLRQQNLAVAGKKSELVQRLLSTSAATAETTTRPAARRAPRTREVATPIRSPSSNDSNSAASADNSFAEIGVPTRVVTRLHDMGLATPTPIQKEAIPLALRGKDVLGLAQTGTGKTLAFGVPLVAKILNDGKRADNRACTGLVLAPTRELANQIAEQLRALTETTPVQTMVVVGGQNIQTQINKLARGTDLLVATPGRLIDLMDRKALTLRDTSFLVLDEADMMLDMGFAPALKQIVQKLPVKRQTMLFSATMAKSMNEIAGRFLKNPVRVEVARAGQTADKITQELHYVAKPDKHDLLLELLSRHGDEKALVFGRTKHGMEKLSKRLLSRGIRAGSIHGNKSQPQRDKAIRDFKAGHMSVLVATDVAARGIDIPDVKHVYNFELPNTPEAYVHRIGRTARAGKEGAAISFCSMEEMDDLQAIEKLVGVKMKLVSGKAWSQAAANREKTRIKEFKATEQKARKKGREKNQKKRASSTERY